jgi:molecular chaperone IbpA
LTANARFCGLGGRAGAFKSPSKAEKAEREFLYRGISTRHFKRQFSLADYVQVKGATFDNGLLKIELVREIPEAMKPRRIAINGASTADNVHQIEAKAG